MASIVPSRLEHFHRFNDLRAELRVNVWKLASHFQRNMDLWTRRFTPDEMGKDIPLSKRGPWIVFTTRPAPEILHVSREARSEGLKYYALSFGVRFKRWRGDGYFYLAKVYVNWEVDRICVMDTYVELSLRRHYIYSNVAPEHLDSFAGTCARNGLKYLAVNCSNQRKLVDADRHGRWFEFRQFCSFIPTEGHLEELLLFDDVNWVGKDGESAVDAAHIDADKPVVLNAVAKHLEPQHLQLLQSKIDLETYFSSDNYLDKETTKWFPSVKVVLSTLERPTEQIGQ